MLCRRRLIFSRCASSSSSSCFAEHRAQRGLRELRSLVNVIGNFDHGFARIDDAQKDDSIDLKGHVVAGDDVLRRNLEGFLPKRNAHHPVHAAQIPELRPVPLLCGNRRPKPKDHAALVLRQNLDRTQNIQSNDDKGDAEESKSEDFHWCLHVRRRTLYRRIVTQATRDERGIRTRAVAWLVRDPTKKSPAPGCVESPPRVRPEAAGHPSRCTTTDCPADTSHDETASQSSPWTKTLPFGERLVWAMPISPIIPSEPVTTLFRLALRASVIRKAVINPRGILTASAVNR